MKADKKKASESGSSSWNSSDKLKEKKPISTQSLISIKDAKPCTLYSEYKKKSARFKPYTIISHAEG